MTNSPDPSSHRQREQELVAHVQRLLGDERLRVDTTRGRRPVTSFLTRVELTDKGVDLKRMMSEMKRPDRDLESRMPVGQSLDVELSQKKWMFLRSTVGRLRVICVSPTRALIAGETPQPMATGDVQKLLSAASPPGGVPTTVVLLSTSGFTLEAHELAERRADRTVIMVEPNEAGGWSVAGPAETKALTDLFDPEGDAIKRQRIRESIESAKTDLLGSGLAADRIAAKTQLPTQLIESELKSYAKENPGLAAKRLDGRVVLFREGAMPAANASGGSNVPMLDRIKSLFSLKGENQKKISFLSERRTALGQQRDRAYDEMSALEKQESGLRAQFKEATGAITKRRVTSQLLQLRKDIERRQQLLTVLNQQINVVSTHLHNLELVQQGQSAKLPDSEEMASDAAAAEEMLATLQADTELADSVGAVAHAGMSAEEQALYEELEKESGGESASGTKIKLDTVETEEDEQASVEPPRPTADRPRRTEPEAG